VIQIEKLLSQFFSATINIFVAEISLKTHIILRKNVYFFGPSEVELDLN